jgi:hypothetical protein
MNPIALKRHLAILTNPGVPSPKDGIYTVGILLDGSPTHKQVPLIDHHELGAPTIGVAAITAIPIGRLSDGATICTFVANIATNEKIGIGQNVSISYQVKQQHHSDEMNIHFTTLDDILEVSLVDIAHIAGAEIIDPTTLQQRLITEQMRALQEHIQVGSPFVSAAAACAAILSAKTKPDTQEPK